MYLKLFAAMLWLHMFGIIAIAQNETKNKDLKFEKIKIHSSTIEEEINAVLVTIDNNGISDLAFLYLRKPPNIFGRIKQSGSSSKRSLEFVNQSGRQYLIKIPIKILYKNDGFREFLENIKSYVDQKTQKKLLKIADDEKEFKKLANSKLNLRLVVSPGTRAAFPPEIMSYFKGGKFIENGAVFRIELETAEKTKIPINKTGYFSVKEGATPVASQYTWGVKASFSAIIDPNIGETLRLPSQKQKNDAEEKKTAWDGESNRHWQASGTMVFGANLRDRAKAEIQFSYKKGDFGNQKKDVFEVEGYRFDVFPKAISNGKDELLFSLSLGKYEMYNPSNAIAISEGGEGVQAFLYTGKANISMAHIVNREGLEGKADPENLDKRVSILQIDAPLGLPILGKGGGPVLPKHFSLRNIQGTFLYGEEQSNKMMEIEDSSSDMPRMVQVNFPYDYWTAGGEVFFSKPQTNLLAFEGSLAFYHSRRNMNAFPSTNETENPEKESIDNDRDAYFYGPISDGQGSVCLLTANWNRISENKEDKEENSDNVNKSVNDVGKFKYGFSLQLGYGTGDDPMTATKDEGYLGETARFQPDTLFLKSLSKKFLFGPEGTQINPIGPGLENKIYIGFSYLDNRKLINPLYWFYNMLNITGDNDDEVQSTTTEIKYNYYHLNKPLLFNFGNEDVSKRQTIGHEISTKFNVELPKGINTSLEYARFFPEDLLAAYLPKDPWQISLSISLSL